MTRLFGKGTGWIYKEIPIHKRKENMIRIYYGSLLDNEDNRYKEVPVQWIKSFKPSFFGDYRIKITYIDYIHERPEDLPDTAKYIEFVYA